MLLSEEEVKIKSQLWFAENEEYLKEMECEGVYTLNHFLFLNSKKGKT
jgi:hypothetical protein